MAIADALPLTSLPEVVQVMLPFLGYVAGMVVYTVFIFEFYRYVARRDLFELELVGYARGRQRVRNLMRMGLYAVKYLVVFPTVIIAWYLAFTFLVALLSGGAAVESLLVLTMAVVTTTRITAYYNEDLSRDIAKMVPFAILGVFVIDGIEALSVGSVVAILDAIPEYWPVILTYWIFTVLLEFSLRTVTIARFGTVETVEEEAPTAAEREADEA